MKKYEIQANLQIGDFIIIQIVFLNVPEIKYCIFSFIIFNIILVKYFSEKAMKFTSSLGQKFSDTVKTEADNLKKEVDNEKV